MTGIYYYEAPTGLDMPGLVDPVNLPGAYRVIARPNAKSIHGMAGDILRSCGVTRDLYRKSAGVTTLLSLAAAWGLALNVTDVYVGEAQDMAAPTILETIEFAHRFGATVHFIFAFSQTHVHADRLIRYGGALRAYTDLPDPIRNPENHPAPPPPVFVERVERDWPEVAADDWTTYRGAYLRAFPAQDAADADVIYRDAYNAFLSAHVTTAEEAAQLVGQLWTTHGFDEFERDTVTAAMQAALWRNRTHSKVDAIKLTRYVTRYIANGMTTAHYHVMRAYPDPWRAAATALHAHHIPTLDMLELHARDVTPDGQIPTLDNTFESDAAVLIAAQRWRQILLQGADPPLFGMSANSLRQGMKKVIRELDLPLSDDFKRPAKQRFHPVIGIKMEAY